MLGGAEWRGKEQVSELWTIVKAISEREGMQHAPAEIQYARSGITYWPDGNIIGCTATNGQ